MAVGVLVLNAKGFINLGAVVISLLIPLSIVITHTTHKVLTPLEFISESDYYRSSLWLIASIVIPILVINSRKKALFYCLLSIPFLVIFLLNPIYSWFGAGIVEKGFDPDKLFLFNVITAIVGLLVAMGLLFLDNVTNHYKRKMERLQEKLLESEKMASIGVFASGMSHEINNPLNFIKGGSEIIKSKLISHELIDQEFKKDALGLIDSGVDRIAKIISSLQQFSQGKTSINDRCDIHEILNECVLSIRSKSNINLEIKIEFEKEELIIQGDSNQLYHAFLNIITNATQAVGSKNGVISITTQKNKELCIIRFEDNGEGIAAKNISRVMDPFFTTREPGNGIGMGLSIAYYIIKGHQGILDIQSERNVGTRVTVSLLNDLQY